MSNLTVQRIIYRNLVQRPTVNRALDSFGRRLNNLLDSLGIQKRYATGLTRNKAILFSSNDPARLNQARKDLLTYNRARADIAVAVFDITQFKLLEKKYHVTIDFLRRIGEGIEICDIDSLLSFASRMAGGYTSYAYRALTELIKVGLGKEEIIALLSSAWQAGRDGCGYRDLPSAVASLREVGFGKKEEIIALLSSAKKAALGGSAYLTLPSAITRLRETGLDNAQTISLLCSVSQAAEEYTSSAYEALPPAVASLREVGLDNAQTISLLCSVSQAAGKATSSAYETLPPAVAGLREAGLDNTQTTSLISLVSQVAAKDTSAAYRALPPAVAGLREAGLDNTQTTSLISLVSQVAAKDTSAAYRALPELIKVGLGKEESIALLSSVSQAAGRETSSAYEALPELIRVGLGKEETISLLSSVSKAAGRDKRVAYLALGSMFSGLSFLNTASAKLAARKFLFMLDSLTDHNRERVLTLLYNERDLFSSLGKDNFLPHFNLYLDILTSRKRLGLTLLEGIFEAIEMGIIPKVLTREEVCRVNHFIDRNHSFSSILYRLYRENEAVLDEFIPLAVKISRDQFGQQEIAQLLARYQQYDGLEILSAVIQMAIPLSGASFIKRAEVKGLLQKIVEAGDLRAQLPAALRGETKQVSLAVKHYSLKAGQVIDLSNINPILDGLRNVTKAEEADLVKALADYLRDGKNDPEKVRQVLYRYASRRDLLGEKVDRLGSADFYTIRLLEEIFLDKDSLISLLVRALDQLEPTLLTTKKTSLTKPAALAEAINKMWQSTGTRDEKLKRLAGISARYREADLQTLAASGKLPPETSAALDDLIRQNNQAYISKHKLAEELLKEPLAAIQVQKNKFDLTTTAETLNLRLQVVKGIPYGLYGLCAGVCVAADLELWQDPNFKLIALTDEATGSAVGFIHIYEQMVAGKRIWTLPGINPSTEFMGTVNPAELYDRMIEQAVSLAQAAGADGVYIPTSPAIHSNRSDIQKTIKEKKYPIRSIPKVNWSRQPNYPFNEVFVVWER